MYNSYLNNDFYYSQFAEPKDNVIHTIESDDNLNEPEKCCDDNNPPVHKENNSLLSGMFNNFKSPELNAETLILAGVVFFSIFDDDDFDMDLILIIGILFLIGI